MGGWAGRGACGAGGGAGRAARPAPTTLARHRPPAHTHAHPAHTHTHPPHAPSLPTAAVKRIEDPIGLLPPKLILGINKRGVHFFRPVPKEYLHSAELRDIMQFGSSAQVGWAAWWCMGWEVVAGVPAHLLHTPPKHT